MKPVFEHDWDLTPSEAISLQKKLASKVEIASLTTNVRYVAGIDCAPSADMSKYFAAVVIWDLKIREMLEYHIAEKPLTFPYIPGLLSFREIPAILEVIKEIHQEPDVIIVDGHGIAHPRRLRIAAHLGVLLDRPTFGCGKSVLYGDYKEPDVERGSTRPLMKNNEIIGNIVRTRSNVKPVIVSVG
ncbi:MAG: endonuclease V, partial [Neisseriaceae bacterium]